MSQHDRKIVDEDIKHQHKQANQCSGVVSSLISVHLVEKSVDPDQM